MFPSYSNVQYADNFFNLKKFMYLEDSQICSYI